MLNIFELISFCTSETYVFFWVQLIDEIEQICELVAAFFSMGHRVI